MKSPVNNACVSGPVSSRRRVMYIKPHCNQSVAAKLKLLLDQLK